MIDTATQTINLNQLDKTDWQSFRLDQIAKSVSERVDPNNTDIEVYIGLEHLDSESLHVKRMGTPADVNGQKLKCYPGDVIFGKRRAYQRKAAIATTEAICSAHAMVLRANPEVIDPKLFPFFLHSDQFMHRAIDISVGSLSPTINWKTLREQEFLLPPKAQQAEIAELLWAMDEVVQKGDCVLQKLEVQKHTLFNEMHKLRYKSYKTLDELCSKISSGGTPSRKSSQDFYGGEIPWVKTKELNDWLITDTEEKITSLGLKKSSAKLYPEQTILLAMYGATVGKIGIIQKEMACNQACCALVVNDKQADYWFLFYYLTALKKRLVALSVGSAQPNISSSLIKKLKIPDISKDQQSYFSSRLKLIDELRFESIFKLKTSKSLQQSLINQVF